MTRNRFALVLLAVALAACRKDDLEFQPPPEIRPVLRQVSGVIVDAATGALVTGAVDVSVLGANGQPSAYALDLDGAPQNRFTTQTGVVSFQSSLAAPLPTEFVIVARAGACRAGTARVVVSGNGHTTFEVRLVNPAAPPDGVEVASGTGVADGAGAIGAPLTIQTPAGVGGATARLSVPAGTVLRTASGTALTGTLQACLAYYAPGVDDSLAAFPGGLDVIVPSATTPFAFEAGAFVTAGFATVEIADAQGRLAANLSQAAALTLTVPDTTANPETGAVVAAGDPIPLWSQAGTTGRWADQGDLVLGAAAGGLLPAAGSVDQASAANLAWYFPSCPVSRMVAIAGNPGDLGVSLTLRAPDGGYLRELGSTTLPYAFVWDAPSFPVDVIASVNGVEVGRAEGVSLCVPDALNLVVTIPGFQRAWLAATVSRACIQDTRQRSAVGGAVVVLEPRNEIERTRVDGTALFLGLVAGERVTARAFMPNGVQLASQTVTLAPGYNAMDFLFELRCDPGQVTGVTGGSGWN